jgi:hypothetical protein
MIKEEFSFVYNSRTGPKTGLPHFVRNDVGGYCEFSNRA